MGKICPCWASTGCTRQKSENLRSGVFFYVCMDRTIPAAIKSPQPPRKAVLCARLHVLSEGEISNYINFIENNYSLERDAREVINTQAYILHLMNPSEAWANLRRSDYPILKDRRTIEKWSSQFKYPDGDLSTPDRLGYPILEKDYNHNSWQEALDRMDGKDNWHNRVWWDKDHGHFE